MPKLRSPGLVKIFFSSPFGGMEEEREELTRRYFPQIHHLCNTHRLQFSAVDMRWGITAESSENFQVINICLREIDRSDMFIGFFGQRYGWHGAEDKMLQENFDNAVGRYPWLEKFRDKSVTELEFLHGFLNEQGKLPAAIFFRDKSYDDAVREEGVRKGDKKQVFKYSAESELSTSQMNDLKARVSAEKEKSLGVYMDYKTPAEAAKIMFDLIMTYLKDKLLVDLDVKKPTKHEEILSQHDAFLASRCNVYVYCEGYLQQLNHILDTGEKKHVLVTGIAGIGKSALLCNWISSLKHQPSEYIVFYHFTGFAESSTDVNSLLARMVTEFESQYFSMVGGSSNFPREENSGSEPDEVTRALVQRVIWVTSELGSLGKMPIIVLDGLDKIKSTSKIWKVLFWLPSNFPPQCMVVVSTVTTDTQRIEELRSRNYVSVEIEPLTTDAKNEMLIETLKESCKELSPSQVEKIVSAEMTRLPLFLKITLSELVSFGYFRLLDQKIESLISSKSVEELFKKVLERLEKDYNVADYDGNIVEQVMCSLSLSHHGLSEMELQDIYSIPNHVWSPLYFAIEKLTVNQAGFIQFGFIEFKEAVKEKYLSQEEKVQFYLKRLLEYFEDKLRKEADEGPGLTVPDTRPVFELPWLLIQLGDTDKLARCLSHSAVFCELVKSSVYDLVAMWQHTNLTGTEIASILLKTFDNKVAQLYVDLENRGILKNVESPGLQLEPFLKAVDEFLAVSGFYEARETVILRNIKVLMEGLDHGGVLSKEIVEDRLYSCKYQLACLKCEMYKQQEEGIALHEELQKDLESQGKLMPNRSYRHTEKTLIRQLQQELSDLGLHCLQKALKVVSMRQGGEKLERLGFAYNGIACAHLKLGNYDKVIEYCEKSIDCHQRSGDPRAKNFIGASNSNLGLALMEDGKCEEALPYFDRSVKCYQEFHFGETPPVIGEILSNKGICLRRLGQMEEAEKVYKKSLEVKVSALGQNHQVVAMAYVNMGSLELFRGNCERAKEYFKQCLEIYEALEQTWTNVMYVQAQENIIGAEIKLEHYQEVEEDFMKILNWRVKDKSMDGCLATTFRDMGRHYLREGKFEQAYKTMYALLDSKHREDEISYLLLDISVQNLPPSYRENLPKELTLAYGVEKFPGSVPLLKNLVENYLVPAGDEDEIARLINQHHTCLDFAQEVYTLTLDWCQVGGQIVEGCQQRIIQEGLINYPDNLDLHLKLAMSYRRQGHSNLALPHALKVADQQLSNPGLIFFTAQTAALAGEMDTCRKYCQHLLDTCEDQAMKEQVNQLLKLVEDSESTGDGDAQDTGEDSTTEK